MEIRSPRSTGEVMAIADVAAAAFGANALSEPWRERYAFVEQVFGREVFLALEEGGRFVSSCTCLPACVWVGGRRVPMGAVGGVATLPECRKHGYAGAVMCAVVRRMHEHGLALSALWPFSFPYYRKFGWDFACENRGCRFKPEALGPLPAPDGVSAATDAHLPGVMACYQTHAQALAFCTDRHEAWWRNLLRIEGVPPFAPAGDARGRMLVCREGDDVAGYAIYSPPAGEERRLSVKECVALTAGARMRLMAALVEEGAGEISLRLPSNDRLWAQVPDPRQVVVALEPGFSFRVVDPVAALGALPAPAGLSGRIAFSLRDPARPEAPLHCLVTVEGGRVAATGAGEGAGADHRLAADIPTFSQIYSGYLRPGQARWLGRIEADQASAEFAERLFPQWTAFRSALEPG